MTSSVQHDAGPSTADFRASDADREAVVRTLHDAVVKGRLTIEECDERVAAAYAARFLRELPPLTADLPPAAPPAPVPPGWRALAVVAWLQLRTALAGISWRSVRGRPRLAIAAVAVLALLFVGASATGALSDGGHEFHQAQFEHR
jgi:Domain of unknown function (DUF1707)